MRSTSDHPRDSDGIWVWAASESATPGGKKQRFWRSFFLLIDFKQNMSGLPHHSVEIIGDNAFVFRLTELDVQRKCI